MIQQIRQIHHLSIERDFDNDIYIFRNSKTGEVFKTRSLFEANKKFEDEYYN